MNNLINYSISGIRGMLLASLIRGDVVFDLEKNQNQKNLAIL